MVGLKLKVLFLASFIPKRFQNGLITEGKDSTIVPITKSVEQCAHMVVV
jgi:hypothetical protein